MDNDASIPTGIPLLSGLKETQAGQPCSTTAPLRSSSPTNGNEERQFSGSSQTNDGFQAPMLQTGGNQLLVSPSGGPVSPYMASSDNDNVRKIFVTDNDGEPLSPKNLFQNKWKSMMLAGIGFFADSYDLFVVNVVLKIMENLYTPTDTSRSLVASAALIGAVMGQLIFGFFSDVLGRRIMFIATAAFVTFGAILSACAIENDYINIYTQISIARFFLGFGVGGEYPLGAAVTSESTRPETRGRGMMAVFSMQGFGALTSSFLSWSCLALGMKEEITWRFVLAFGAIPSAIAFCCRLYMEETESFQQIKSKAESTVDSGPCILDDSSIEIESPMMQNADKATCTETSFTKKKKSFVLKTQPSGLSVASVRASSVLRGLQRYWLHCIGTAGAWFIFDVVFYANALFNAEIMELFGLGESPQEFALNAIYLSLFGIPGYFLSFLFIDLMGRKQLQIFGFVAMMILFLILATCSKWLVQVPVFFVIIYGLTFLFSNFGPNATTYVIPGEIYPTDVKGTLHGISAAAGKLGATVGAYTFPHLSKTQAMYLSAFVALWGAVHTIFTCPLYSTDELALVSEGKFVKVTFACCKAQQRFMEGKSEDENAKNLKNSETESLSFPMNVRKYFKIGKTTAKTLPTTNSAERLDKE
eukprot:g1726.t1